jgi:hypothetical protein
MMRRVVGGPFDVLSRRCCRMPEWQNQLGEVFQSLWAFLVALWRLLAELLPHVLGVLLWVVVWLWAVNWKRLWPVLAEGAWAPAVLLLAMATLVWSRLESGALGWQLAWVGSLAGVALFCGYLQGRFGWAPPEIVLEPAPEGEHDPLHAHIHGHNHADDTHAESYDSHGHH